MADVVWHGVPEFGAALEAMTRRVDNGTKQAVRDWESLAERQIKTNATGPARWRNGQNFPRDGGPGNVSGNLRRGIKTEGPVRRGTAWVGWVGPTAIYSRAVELGNPRWKRKKGYPFVEPALRFINRMIPTIAARAWSRAMKR